MSTSTKKYSLRRNLSVLFSASLIPSIIVLWIGYEVDTFDEIAWLTLIVGSVFGLAVTLIVSTKSDEILAYLNLSEENKTTFAKTVLKSNYQELRKLIITYFDSIKNPTTKTSDKRMAFKIILPSVKSFLNNCETATPNTGSKLSHENIVNLGTRFVMLHKLIILLESGDDITFEQHISSLDIDTKDTQDYLNKL